MDIYQESPSLYDCVGVQYLDIEGRLVHLPVGVHLPAMKTAVDGVGSIASERLQLICDGGGDGRRITVKTKVKMDDL